MKPVNYLEMAQSKKPQGPENEAPAPDDEDNPEDMPGQIAMLSSVLKRMAVKHAAQSASKQAPEMHPSIHLLMTAKPKAAAKR